MTQFYIDGLGVIGPGMPDWRTAREVLRGERDYEPALVPRPDAVVLPANERRRAAASVRWALAAAQEAVGAGGYEPGKLATVFATSGSDGDTLHRICESLAGPAREMSPTRFHNSVHNAAAGYWTIAAGTHQPSASVCGYDASFSVGLVEAASQVSAERSAVLLVAYDLPYPPPLHAARPLGQPFAVALLLAPEPRPATLACCRIALTPGSVDGVAFPAALRAELASNPAGQALPLLAMLAREEHGPVRLAYLDACGLVVERVK
jgi:beta-ketoacyl synthase-like protein